MRSLLALCLFSGGVPVQAQVVDPLWAVWSDTTRSDSERYDALGKAAWARMFTEPDSALSLALLLYEHASEKPDRRSQAMATTYQGIAYSVLGNHFAARGCYHQMIELYSAIGDQRGVAGAYNNLGALYHELGDPAQAVGWYAKSIPVFEDLGDAKGMASVYNNLSGIYNERGDTTNALFFARKCLELNSTTGDARAMANTISNIGLVYMEAGSLERAMEWLQRSLLEKERSGDEPGKAKTIHDIGETYRRMGRLDSAAIQFERSMAIRERLHDEAGIILSLTSQGFLDLDLGKPQHALVPCERARSMARELDMLTKERNACDCLYRAYKALGRGTDALVHFERFTALGDSLHAEEVDKQLRQLEFDRLVMADSLQRRTARMTSELQAEQASGQRSRWVMVAVALLLLGGLVFGLRRRRVKRPGDGDGPH